jgi:hypothetical protein
MDSHLKQKCVFSSFEDISCHFSYISHFFAHRDQFIISPSANRIVLVVSPNPFFFSIICFEIPSISLGLKCQI